MEIILNKDLSEENYRLWESYLNNHKNGNIFQSPVFFKTYKYTNGNSPFVIIVKNDDGGISGVLLAVIQKVHNGLFGKFTARAIIWGGPVYNDRETLNKLLDVYGNEIGGRAIYTEVRNLWNTNEDIDIFETFGFTFEDHLDIIVDLKLKEEELWSQVHSKRRNEIRRAKKENLVFKEETNLQGLEKCYNILREVYFHAKIPLVDFSFFSSLLKFSSKDNGIRIFIAQLEEEIIGCMITVVYNKTVYDLYAGSFRKFYKKYPNDLIPWEVFLWGQRNGFEKFDFGGAGKPNVPYGVREYKKKYGGELVNSGRFIVPHNWIGYKIAISGFSLWKKLKSFRKWKV